MSWRDAPLYVEADDLAAWVLEQTHRWPPEVGEHLAPLAARAGCDLVCAVALALTFPARRAEHLEQADEGIVRLRTLLRLARRQHLLSPGGLRHASGRLRAIGRMVGGWRKRLPKPAAERRPHHPPPYPGDGLPAPPGA
ncbi:MAG: hypothetical protein GY928_30095 [Colwellia sp.]|nr:hypothetical protein [Colwellia sp.]